MQLCRYTGAAPVTPRAYQRGDPAPARRPDHRLPTPCARRSPTSSSTTSCSSELGPAAHRRRAPCSSTARRAPASRASPSASSACTTTTCSCPTRSRSTARSSPCSTRSCTGPPTSSPPTSIRAGCCASGPFIIVGGELHRSHARPHLPARQRHLPRPAPDAGQQRHPRHRRLRPPDADARGAAQPVDRAARPPGRLPVARATA